MTRQEAERLVRAIRCGGPVMADAEVSVSDYGPGLKTVCVVEDGLEREYRSEEEFATGRPAREGRPAGAGEVRAYPAKGLRLT